MQCLWDFDVINKQVTSKYNAMKISSSFDIYNIYDLLNAQSTNTRLHYGGHTYIPSY